jgi:hypothetical protein
MKYPHQQSANWRNSLLGPRDLISRGWRMVAFIHLPNHALLYTVLTFTAPQCIGTWLILERMIINNEDPKSPLLARGNFLFPAELKSGLGGVQTLTIAW